MSTEQEEQLSSCENQVQYYTNKIKETPEYEFAGVYADEGISGTNTIKRKQFNRMIADCRKGLIDVVLTKSISRFTRNTKDCLEYVRELKENGVSVIFEKENINTMDAAGEVLLTILSSLAQDESRSISENSSWGIRSRFAQGKYKISTKRFLGYDEDKNGKLVVNKKQAKIVKRIFEEYLTGITTDEIARRLTADGAKNWDGKCHWDGNVLKKMLQNEKYMGDAILQKTYTKDFLTKKRAKNNGELKKYYIKDDHEAIVDKETWNAVQQEIARRKQYVKDHELQVYSREPKDNPFFAKVICGECGHSFGRVITTNRQGGRIQKWRCWAYKRDMHRTCTNRYVFEDALINLFMMAWNSIAENPEGFEERWKGNLASDSELLRYKTRQIMEEAKRGPIKEFDPWLMLKVMDHITVYEVGALGIRFYDGTEFRCEVE